MVSFRFGMNVGFAPALGDESAATERWGCVWIHVDATVGEACTKTIACHTLSSPVQIDRIVGPESNPPGTSAGTLNVASFSAYPCCWLGAYEPVRTAPVQ